MRNLVSSAMLSFLSDDHKKCIDFVNVSFRIRHAVFDESLTDPEFQKEMDEFFASRAMATASSSSAANAIDEEYTRL